MSSHSISPSADGFIAVSEYLRQCPEKPSKRHNKNDAVSSDKQYSTLHLVETAKNSRSKSVEAGDIIACVREQITFDFHNGLRSSRKLAKKYRLPRAVIQDVVLLAMRMVPKSARQAVPVMAAGVQAGVQASVQAVPMLVNRRSA